MRSRCLALLLLFAVVACSKGDTKKQPEPAGSNTGSAPVATAENTVEILVDDQVVGKLAPEQVALWPRLDTLVPMAARRLGTWQTITIKGKSSVDVQQPSATHPDLVPAVFPGDGGAPAFGMFDPVELAKKGKPALREDAITAVQIKLAKDSGRGQNDHHQSGTEAGDPSKLEIKVKSAAGEQVVTGSQLLEAAREPIPGETGEGRGWSLALILDKAGVKKYEKLLLTGENGTNLTLEKRDLDAKTSVPFVKLNRQGSLRFRVYKKQGDTWQPGADLRGLVSVEVLK